MRLPSVRFTMRRMMVAVAIVAFLIGGGIEAARLKQLRESHLEAIREVGLALEFPWWPRLASSLNPRCLRCVSPTRPT
jgi:hypothetical protein